MIAALFAIYSLALSYLKDAELGILAILGALLFLALLAAYKHSKAFQLFTIIADAMALSLVFKIFNIFNIEVFHYIMLILIPMLMAIELTLNGARGMKTPRAGGRCKRGIVAPMAYVALVCALSVTIASSGLYKIYFLGDGYSNMQILLLIAIATLFFIPLYERY